MPRDRGRNVNWRLTALSLAVAVGCVIVVDALALLLPSVQIRGIRLTYIVVLGIAVVLTIIVLGASLRKPSSQKASAVTVGNAQIKADAGNMLTPVIVAGILHAVVQQLELLKEVKASVDEQGKQLPVLQADLTKIADEMKAIDNKNLGIQVLLAAVTTLIGFAGSLVLMLFSTPAAGR